MIYSKSNPVYEDAWIHRLLVGMETILIPKWNVLTATCKFISRIEILNGKEVFYYNGNYMDILTDDRVNFVSHVSVDSNMRHVDLLKRFNATLVCQANLKTLYPTITHRADAELRKDIEDVLMMHVEPTEYKGFTFNQSDIKDMQPFHTVKFNFEIVL